MQRPEGSDQDSTCQTILDGWVRSAFPRPDVDPEWLAECLQWIFDEEKEFQETNGSSRVGASFANFWQKIVEQLLESDLTQSTIGGSGFGMQIRDQESGHLQGPPLLVQVVAITEIDRPNRSPTFKLKLSDGTRIVNATIHSSLLASRNIEFSSMRLGYKLKDALEQMLLDEPRFRDGVVHLQSNTVALMGGGCSDFEEKQTIFRTKK